MFSDFFPAKGFPNKARFFPISGLIMSNLGCTQEKFGYFGFMSEGILFPLSQISIFFSRFSTILRRESHALISFFSILVVDLVPSISLDFGKGI